MSIRIKVARWHLLRAFSLLGLTQQEAGLAKKIWEVRTELKRHTKLVGGRDEDS